nr:hypothetical protein GCM10020092_062370 [Actinoplanes digitatis]
MTGFWGLEVTNDYARDADVVLAIATRFAETDASSWDPAYTWNFPPSRLIQIDIDPAEIGRNYPVEIGVVADAAIAVPAIAGAVRRRHPDRVSRPDLRERIHKARTELFAASAERGRSDAFPLRPERILADLRAALLGRRGAGHRRRLEQERRRAVLPAARARPVHHARRRVHNGLRTGRRAGRAARPARPGGGRARRRRRDERAAAEPCRWRSSGACR